MCMLYIYLFIYILLERKKWVNIISIRIKGYLVKKICVSVQLGMFKCWGFNNFRNFIDFIIQ